MIFLPKLYAISLLQFKLKHEEHVCSFVSHAGGPQQKSSAGYIVAQSARTLQGRYIYWLLGWKFLCAHCNNEEEGKQHWQAEAVKHFHIS
jgi:hypothetical protein